MSNILKEVQLELDYSCGKISYEFILGQVKDSTIQHFQLTPNMRVCVITLQSGHEVIGVAQVLDAGNDVEEIGQGVAKNDAIEKLWKVFGAMAKAITPDTRITG